MVKVGGSEYKFFLCFLKVKRNILRIIQIKNKDGEFVKDIQKIVKVFVEFVKGMLGKKVLISVKADDRIFDMGNRLSIEY